MDLRIPASWAIALTLVASMATGCIYPTRHTSLTLVRAGRDTHAFNAPSSIWALTIVEAHLRPHKRGDLSWDDDEGLPDVYCRIYRDEVMMWESETIDDTLTPEWNVTLPQNVRLDSHRALRIELWDRDIVGSDPAGMYRRHGLPENAIPDADARILLEGGAYLTIRVTAPQAHRGVGIARYEVRPDELVLLEVHPYSPAGRADLEAGDAIVQIGERQVSAMSDAQAASALSMSSSREDTLMVRNEQGTERQVELDRGFVWLTM